MAQTDGRSTEEKLGGQGLGLWVILACPQVSQWPSQGVASLGHVATLGTGLVAALSQCL